MVNTNKVKARIVELGFKYYEVAKALDIDATTLNLKLTNERRIYLTEVSKLCDLLQINTPEQLKEYFDLDFLILPKSHENVIQNVELDTKKR